MDKVSIIIVTHKRYDLLRQCFRYVKSTQKENFEIETIVVDNGSEEKVRVEVEKLCKAEGSKYLRLHENMSFSHANNLAAKETTGNHLLLLNDDAFPINENWLIEMLACMKRHEKAGVVGAKLLFQDGRIQHAGVCFKEDGEPFHVLLWQDMLDPRSMKERQFQAVTFACVLIKRECWDKIDGLLEEGKAFEYWYEDIDFCIRAREAGYEIWYTPAAMIFHLCGSTSRDSFNTREKIFKHLKTRVEKWKGRVKFGDEQEHIC